MANRRISELPELQGIDLANADLFTVVHVAEVDPGLKNKKIQTSEFRTYLNGYYLTLTGGTVGGSVTFATGIIASGTSTFKDVTITGTTTLSNLSITDLTVTNRISGYLITGETFQATNLTAATGNINTFTASQATVISGIFTSLSGTTITGTTSNVTNSNFQTASGVTVIGGTVSGTVVTGNTGKFSNIKWRIYFSAFWSSNHW